MRLDVSRGTVTTAKGRHTATWDSKSARATPVNSCRLRYATASWTAPLGHPHAPQPDPLFIAFSLPSRLAKSRRRPAVGQNLECPTEPI